MFNIFGENRHLSSNIEIVIFITSSKAKTEQIISVELQYFYRFVLSEFCNKEFDPEHWNVLKHVTQNTLTCIPDSMYSNTRSVYRTFQRFLVLRLCKKYFILIFIYHLQKKADLFLVKNILRGLNTRFIDFVYRMLSLLEE